ncbi:hypothetical protein LXD69_10190 [Flavobacterium sediminilitoris]|uniref:Uncharacterized protein n=1 Tax=Flavobacterium sediminilitoris TaxID=2024526 RepID=A0ABY4HID8_9FLAO|nr:MULTISPECIES: hypothetical protein [Flavobacterium]UOX32421.1 hypothetical protein LXD69_10190 [Flavobacterium sediminilitoris]
MTYVKSIISKKIYLIENGIYIMIPFDDSNQLYLTFIEWLSEGNSIELFEGTSKEIQNSQLELKLLEIKNKYEFHKINGWDAYQNFRAKVVNDIYNGLISEEQAFIIEENLSVAYDQISTTGDWKTARYKLLQVSPYPPYVQPYYDLAIILINDYITNNYED